MTEDPQVTWENYYGRIQGRRVSEARVLWADMERQGVDESTVLAIDFVLFSSDASRAESLAEQLRENYSVTLKDDEDSTYTLIEGTTRPYGVTLSRRAFFRWIDFMGEVARSHGCVFSGWSAESRELKRSWSNEELDDSTG